MWGVNYRFVNVTNFHTCNSCSVTLFSTVLVTDEQLLKVSYYVVGCSCVHVPVCINDIGDCCCCCGMGTSLYQRYRRLLLLVQDALDRARMTHQTDASKPDTEGALHYSCYAGVRWPPPQPGELYI
jgi:hypothetical protein